jgi:3-deoxy-D-arabino-heptulosonate 7-phosphate (DAHP) synthase class II
LLNDAYSKYYAPEHLAMGKVIILWRIDPLSGNSETAANNNKRTVFSVVCAMTVAMQRHAKHTSYNTGRTVFSTWSVPRNYLEDR